MTQTRSLQSWSLESTVIKYFQCVLQNRELGKDQATEGSAGHSKECEFYSKHDGGGGGGDTT